MRLEARGYIDRVADASWTPKAGVTVRDEGEGWNPGLHDAGYRVLGVTSFELD